MFIFLKNGPSIGIRGGPLCEKSDHFGHVGHVEGFVLPVEVSGYKEIEPSNGFSNLGVKMIFGGVVVPE